MSKFNRNLIIILVLQIGILIASFVATKTTSPEKAEKIFKKLDVEDVAKIQIEDADKKTLTLEKQNNEWILASGGGYPVKMNSVSDFLGKLVSLKAKSPIVSKKEHHHTLEVATEKFQRKIIVTLKQGDPYEFLLGKSSGAKNIHFRFTKENDVYLAKGLSAWDAETAPSNWVNADFFKPEKEKIVSISLTNKNGNLTFAKNDKGFWSLAELSSEKKLDNAKLTTFLNSISSLSLDEPVGKKTEESFGLSQPVATLTVITETEIKEKDKEKKAETKDAIAKDLANVDGKDKKPEAKDLTATDQNNLEKIADQTAKKPDTETQPTKKVERKTHILKLGVKKDENYYAKSSQSDFVALISSTSVSSIVDNKVADFVQDEKKQKNARPNLPAGLPKGLEGMNISK